MNRAPKTPRHSVIDNHPKRDEIVRDIVGGRTMRDIAEAYGISRSSVSRFKNSMVDREVGKVRLESELDFQASNEGIIEELGRAMGTSRKMLDACDRFLQDPENPDVYDLGPRAGEIQVQYTIPGKRGPIKKKATLQELLDEVHGVGGRAVQVVQYKTADPRKLVLQTAETITRHLDLAAKIAAAMNESNNRLADEQELSKLSRVILEATKDHPEARKAIEDALRSS